MEANKFDMIKPKDYDFDMRILKEKSNSNLVLIILNRPIIIPNFDKLTEMADIIICADAGADHYLKALGNNW